MSDKLINNLHYLLLLADTSTSRAQKQALLQTASKVQLLTISEIALNVTRGSLPIEPAVKSTLVRHVGNIRVLASKRATLTDRREALTVPVVEALLLPARTFLKQLAQREWKA